MNCCKRSTSSASVGALIGFITQTGNPIVTQTKNNIVAQAMSREKKYTDPTFTECETASDEVILMVVDKSDTSQSAQGSTKFIKATTLGGDGITMEESAYMAETGIDISE